MAPGPPPCAGKRARHVAARFAWHANAPHPSAASQHGLDWLNFFIADVETAFGPFVPVYLSAKGWGQGAIGTVITVNSAVALATQIPPGWLVDWTHYKRVVVAACLACIAPDRCKS